MSKLAKNFLYVMVAVLFLGCGWFGFKWIYFLNSPLVTSNQQPVKVIVSFGDSAKKIASNLKQKELLKNPDVFVLFIRLSGAERYLQAGEYLVEPGITTPRQLIRNMTNGESVRHAFTIVEGWTFAQIIAALNSNKYIPHTIQNLQIPEIMEKLKHPGEIPEGKFAADTYFFSGDMTDLDILSTAYQLLQKRLKTAWDNRDISVPYHCPYEALIVASLIEKETACSKEKPLIAGVILGRLEKGMLLQVDPTVIYGLGAKFTGKLKKTDLLINTTYNTYVHKGLPPTPIAMPSIDSIEAALHPAKTTHLYYVAKGDGTHEFSDFLKGQIEAIKKYLKK